MIRIRGRARPNHRPDTDLIAGQLLMKQFYISKAFHIKLKSHSSGTQDATRGIKVSTALYGISCREPFRLCVLP